MQKLQNKLVIILISVVLYSISRSILADVQITGLQDFAFGTVYPPYTTQTIEYNDICIYNSSPNKKYYITATGDNDSGGNFYLKSSTYTIRYEVSWHQYGETTWTILDPSQRSPVFGQASRNLLCAGDSKRASLRIRIDATWFSGSQRAGTYSDTLTILLEPG